MLGKIERRRRRRWQRVSRMDSITDPMNTNLSKLWETVEDKGAWNVHETSKSQTPLSDWTTADDDHQRKSASWHRKTFLNYFNWSNIRSIPSCSLAGGNYELYEHQSKFKAYFYSISVLILWSHYPYHEDVYHQNLNVYLSPHKTNCFAFKVKLKRSFLKSEFYTNIKKADISPSSEWNSRNFIVVSWIESEYLN